MQMLLDQAALAMGGSCEEAVDFPFRPVFESLSMRCCGLLPYSVRALPLGCLCCSLTFFIARRLHPLGRT